VSLKVLDNARANALINRKFGSGTHMPEKLSIKPREKHRNNLSCASQAERGRNQYPPKTTGRVPKPKNQKHNRNADSGRFPNRASNTRMLHVSRKEHAAEKCIQAYPSGLAYW
jgi:hypothetical protein